MKLGRDLFFYGMGWGLWMLKWGLWMLKWGLRGLKWVLRRLRYGLPSVEVQMGSLRSAAGVFGGLTYGRLD